MEIRQYRYAVTDDGAVRGVSCSTTNIKVTVGNASAFCSITVYQPVTSILLSKSSAAMAAGDTLSLTASIYPNDATDQSYSWSSSNPAAASVNENGVVTALAKGEAGSGEKPGGEGSQTSPSSVQKPMYPK